MSQLQKIEDFKPQVAGLAGQIIAAQKEDPQIGETPESFKMKFAKTLVFEALRRVGQKNAEKEFTDQIEEDLVEVFIEDFKALTPSEIRIAIKRGALGYYGDVNFISSRTLISWIRNFSEKDRRKANIRRLQIEKPQDETPPEINFETKSNKIRERYDQYLEERWKSPLSCYVFEYEYLNDIGAVKLSLEARWDLVKEAVEIAREGYKKKFAGGDIMAEAYRAAVSMLDKFKERAEERSGSVSSEIQVLSQKLAALRIYQGWAELGIEDPIKEFVKVEGEK